MLSASASVTRTPLPAANANDGAVRSGADVPPDTPAGNSRSPPGYACVKATVPSTRRVGPAYVFAPESVSVPVPTFVRPPTPERTPESVTVAFVVSKVTFVPLAPVKFIFSGEVKPLASEARTTPPPRLIW